MKIETIYFATESGARPAKEFVDTLDASSQRKFFFVRGLLEEFGHKLPEPHAKYLGDDIFELRFRGKEGNVRVLYFFFYQNKVVLTNGFVKKTDKTPRRELDTAIERRKAYLAEYS